jgi:hypothetical protein
MSHDLVNNELRSEKRRADLLDTEMRSVVRRTNTLFKHTLANLDDQIDSDQRMSKLKSQMQTMQSDIDTLKYYCMSQDNEVDDSDNENDDDAVTDDDSDNDEPEHSLIDDIKELLVDDDDVDSPATASEHESVVDNNKSSSLKTLLSKPAVFHISESTGNVTISVAENSSDDNDC